MRLIRIKPSKSELLQQLIYHLTHRFYLFTYCNRSLDTHQSAMLLQFQCGIGLSHIFCTFNITLPVNSRFNAKHFFNRFIGSSEPTICLGMGKAKDSLAFANNFNLLSSQSQAAASYPVATNAIELVAKRIRSLHSLFFKL